MRIIESSNGHARPENRYGVGIRGRELGRRLREHQKATGLTGLTIARTLGVTPSEVSRMMNGLYDAAPTDVAVILAMCGVIGQERDEILELCQTRHNAGVMRMRDGAQRKALLHYAGQADLLVEYQPLMIPLLAQTEEYLQQRILASLPASWAMPAEDDPVAVHQAATHLLDEVDRVELLVHEWALRAPVDPEVCRGQMRALYVLSTRSSVSLRVIPAGQPLPAPALSGFTVLDEYERPTLLYRDEPFSGVFFDDPDYVAAHLEVIKDLYRIALSVAESRALIAQIRDEPAPITPPTESY